MQNGTPVTPRKKDPIQKALSSASKPHWTIRPDEDLRRLVARAIQEFGRDKQFWVHECLRAGLAKYAGKKDGAPQFVVPTTING